jgi:hypothetical protein
MTAYRRDKLRKLEGAPELELDEIDSATWDAIVNARTSERDFQAQVMQAAAALRWSTWHDEATNAPRNCGPCTRARRGRGSKPARYLCEDCRRQVPNVRNKKGLLDLQLLREPRFIIPELKREGERPTDDQLDRLVQLANCGIEAYLWFPHDRDAIFETLASNVRPPADVVLRWQPWRTS